MGHSYSDMLNHIVFSTKHRERIISDELKPKLFAYMAGIIEELEGKAIIINGMPDHVHILTTNSPKISVSEFIGKVKANSSGWVNKQSRARTKFYWQTGYGSFSVSRSKVDEVHNYIADQERHHRKMTFKQEFRGLLKKHGIEFDERYVWD